jgi:NAD(P)-dependent dehydrogenase (short-subunit alcohol dehydrogenase family)
MKDKLVVVTGPTSGVGTEIAMQLAAAGAAIVLACRDVRKGEATAEAIRRRTGAKKLSVMHVDASSQGSIRDFAGRVKRTCTRLDVLVNNAGVYLPRRQQSVDGIELTFATNVLGYHLLTRELLDLLKASAPARIINVASTFAFGVDLDDLQFERRRYIGARAYAQSKACNRLLTWTLGRRLAKSRVTANAMSPGLIITGLYRDTAHLYRLMLRGVGAVYRRTPAQGADTAAWLASSPDAADVSGRFFEERRETRCRFRDPAVEERLWATCERLVGAG